MSSETIPEEIPVENPDTTHAEVNPLQAEVNRLQSVLGTYQQLHADEVFKNAVLTAQLNELRAQGAN
jgi:hypothetical protein